MRTRSIGLWSWACHATLKLIRHFQDRAFIPTTPKFGGLKRVVICMRHFVGWSVFGDFRYETFKKPKFRSAAAGTALAPIGCCYHIRKSGTDRFDNTKSGWCHMICLYIELTLVKIMAIDLPTYISGYHLDITRPSLAILTKTWSNAVQNLGVIYNYLYFACILVSKLHYFAVYHHFGKDYYENKYTHSASTRHPNKIQKMGCVLTLYIVWSPEN
jgi:hypothetical protein